MVMRMMRRAATALVALGGLGGGAAHAQSAGNAAYQTYFLQACTGATGALASLCAASRGGQLSGDSESSLNPNQTSVLASTSLARAQALAEATERRLEGVRAGDSDAKAEGGFGFFGSVQGEWSDQDRGPFDNERGFDADAWRITAGVDWRLSPNTIVGLSATYSDYGSDFDANRPGNAFTPQADAGGIDTEQVTILAFGSTSLSDAVWLDASAGVGFADHRIRRNATFQESNRLIPQTNVRAVGSPDGREYHAAVGLGYDGQMGPLSLGPYARLRYIRTKIDAYTERDGGVGLALNVSRARSTSFTSILGARASYAIGASWGVVVPQARVEFEHEFDDDARTATTRLALDPARTPFRLSNDAPDRNAFNLGASLLFVLPNGFAPYVDYEGQVGYRDASRHRVSAGFRSRF
ncbi:MAG: autotransporter outer membrane beta-barrel domain-containing protein [Phenylobacterium sp.]|uniref:autotransporter outer membrane beta-barrel domain-containing protein n=1 Tax=Phenylobacterium sp. TaxID=1871053 RepID=UPI001A5CCF00|nr:autotransporter outer membrane beta-barrel domain-containing protein [Phenylobacterium sp.]MBL8772628.1 autotransporter outer membrane beta-barrel domain-containing protein [Phenylobacterium sp.]